MTGDAVERREDDIESSSQHNEPQSPSYAETANAVEPVIIGIPAAEAAAEAEIEISTTTPPKSNDHHSPSPAVGRCHGSTKPSTSGEEQGYGQNRREADEHQDEQIHWPHRTGFYVLLCGFVTSLSFGVTQVPLLYVFRLMTCDAYYADEGLPPPSSSATADQSSSFTSMLALHETANFSSVHGPEASVVAGDRCAIHAIESSTALSISLLGASTTIFGLLNLFLTGVLIKRLGLKPTLLIQVFFPALRLLVQNIGVEVWGSAGIIIVQLSQIVSIIGGPSGYVLVLNSFVAEVVEFEGRTAMLGRLSGSMMFGAAVGFLLGGYVADWFSIKAPFRLTLALFLTSCVYVVVFLPYIPPANKQSKADGSGKRKGVLGGFLDPLKVFAPRKFVRASGVLQTQYGAFLLACGVFLGILATGYLPTLLQLYATDVFAFGTKRNGWLIFMYSMLRGVFLMFAFPRLIELGRRLTANKSKEAPPAQEDIGEREPLLSSQSNTGSDTDRPSNKQTPPPPKAVFKFDLIYTRYSLLADGLLTLMCSFVQEGWQMFPVAAILPFAAGTGSASKGTILQMMGSDATSEDRTDALAGISLVENMARMSTTFTFGAIFAGFTSIGRTELVFACNAAVALIGFIVLLFASMPPEGSRRLDRVREENDDH